MTAHAPLPPPLGAARDALVHRLLPGGASTTGFLAPGERLEEVLANDRQTLISLGLTCEQIADQLDRLLGQTERRRMLASRGRAVAAAPGWLDITAKHTLGFQECPFADHERCGGKQPWASADYLLRNTETGLAIEIPGLLPHLVRAHGFFEGSVPYRTDPKVLAQVLGLDPSFDKKPRWCTERVWTPFAWKQGTPWLGIGGPGRYWEAPLMALRGQPTPPRRWEQSVRLGSTLTASRAGDWCVLLARGGPQPLAELTLDDGSFAMASAEGTVQCWRTDCRYVALD